jgi:hypothetical protein
MRSHHGICLLAAALLLCCLCSPPCIAKEAPIETGQALQPAVPVPQRDDDSLLARLRHPRAGIADGVFTMPILHPPDSIVYAMQFAKVRTGNIDNMPILGHHSVAPPTFPDRTLPYRMPDLRLPDTSPESPAPRPRQRIIPPPKHKKAP